MRELLKLLLERLPEGFEFKIIKVKGDAAIHVSIVSGRKKAGWVWDAKTVHRMQNWIMKGEILDLIKNLKPHDTKRKID